MSTDDYNLLPGFFQAMRQEVDDELFKTFNECHEKYKNHLALNREIMPHVINLFIDGFSLGYTHEKGLNDEYIREIKISMDRESYDFEVEIKISLDWMGGNDELIVNYCGVKEFKIPNKNPSADIDFNEVFRNNGIYQHTIYLIGAESLQILFESLSFEIRPKGTPIEES